MGKHSNERRYGTIVLHLDYGLEVALGHGVSGYQRVTETLPSYWDLEKDSIALIGFGVGIINYACIVRRKSKVATVKVKVEMSDFIEMKPPVPWEDLEKVMNSNEALALEYGRRTTLVEWSLWQKIYSNLKHLRQDQSASLEELERIVNDRNTFNDILGIFGSIRDTVILALKFSKFDVSKLQDVMMENQGFNNDCLPKVRAEGSGEMIPMKLTRGLFEELDKVRLLEDKLILKDTQTLPGWEKSIKPHVTGKVVFRKDDKVLEVLDVNRTEVEKVMGVDFIYFNTYYSALVMIQYKRMQEESEEWVYRPDKQFDEEFGRMKKFLERLGSHGFDSKQSYRMNENPFYFKFCQSKIEVDLDENTMIPGMYLPIDYIGQILEDEHSRGRRGGKVINYNNALRYLSNTKFIELVEDSWIGTVPKDSEIIVELIEASLAAGKRIVYAEAGYA